ncbi:DNA replication and repair protein RecO [Ferrimonas sediminum]|uniref:DNA repair protein RecO n=1 Tax=Ferrimonas sediminum TaxID=718193 RepID=A0A1G8Q4Z1_9GAMM|nr:DNA repair protein RecO [Ferrimonas sediminum]SDI99787.1 DNA replication and repair protein RecO [Ferrimonas sediminum]
MDAGWQSAYLLHARPYRERSQLITLLTEQDGKVAAVARSSGKQGGLTKAALQPFQPLKIFLSGSGSLKTLKQVETLSLPVPLQGQKLFCGLYCNELTVRLLSELQECPSLYQGYHQSLLTLAMADSNEAVLRYFEWMLLDYLGVAPLLGQDACGEPLHADGRYSLVAEQGFMPVAGDRGYLGAMLLALQQQQLSDPLHLQQAKHLARTLLKPLLGNKPLRSRELFQRKTRPRTSTS